MGVLKLTDEYISEKISELPTLPTIVYELSNLISDPMSSTKDIEQVMKNDQSMTTKVLKLVNSAYYAIPGGVTNLSRAIAYIGFDTVHQLVLSASIVDAISVEDSPNFQMTDFWKHSIGVAVASEYIAKKTNFSQPADLFTAGLVHDMGKIALFSISDLTFAEIVDFAAEKQCSFEEAEVELGMPKHTNIGKLLAEKWQLPTQLQSIIKFHHTKDAGKREGSSPEVNKMIDIVYLANVLIHAFKFGNSGHSKVLGAPKDVMERLTIDPGAGFKEVVKGIKENLTLADDFLRVIGGGK